MRKLEFYTDGAYSSKSQMGGWAAICVEDDELIDCQSGYEPYSTNNRMELTAFKCALDNISTIETGHTSVVIYTDSAYIANCFNECWFRKWLNNGWRTSDKQDVKNQDLWRPIVAAYIKNKEKFKIQVIKIKSHKKDETGENYKWNNYVDLLAVKKRKELE